MFKYLKAILLCGLLCCTLCACEGEEVKVTPSVTTILGTGEYSLVTTPPTEKVYTDKTTTTEDYGIVTRPRETQDITIVTTTAVSGGALVFEDTTTSNVSIAEQAYWNINLSGVLLNGTDRQRLSFADINFDDVPEVLVMDMNKPVVYEAFDTCPVTVYDLKTMQPLMEFQDCPETFMVCYETLWGNYWGVCIDDAQYKINPDFTMEKVLWSEKTDDSIKYYSYEDEITSFEYDEYCNSDFNYNDRYTKGIHAVCSEYITADNYDKLSTLISNALIDWVAKNDLFDVSVIQ